MGAYFSGKKVSGVVDTGWIDASKYLVNGFKVYSGSYLRYKIRGGIVYFAGIVTPGTDKAGETEVAILSGLPFSLQTNQYSTQPGSTGNLWVANASGTTVTFNRHTSPGKSGWTTAAAGEWLALGGAAFALA
ncbi:hypothetical protein [Lacticaseibacillus hulanensis]|uniref:hypothetical protein n=1 Tax=Lacticaseibacillus hulanensis TaxID=2493111 RepID=UPI000FDBA27A|nr:hypothetical protein [Lacticaseibacillus hulanensis]